MLSIAASGSRQVYRSDAACLFDATGSYAIAFWIASLPSAVSP